jgi:aquaporin Z
MYCLAQLSGGICGGLSYGMLFSKVFNLQPGAHFGWAQAMLVEVLYTCMLCFVVLNVTTVSKNTGNQFYGLAISFVLVAGGYSAGNISGAAFNPAVAFGIDLSSAGVGFGWSIAYSVYEIFGAVLAAALFRVVRPDEFGGSGDYSLGRRLVSEFTGTFFLMLTVGLNVLGKSPAPVFSIAASLMCMIYALGSCSGAYFNPAATLAVILSGRGKCDPKEGFAYMGVQILASICASVTYAIIYGTTFPLQPGTDADGLQFSYVGAGFAEIVFTFVLCFVVLSVATIPEPDRDMLGFAIASCVTAGGYAIGAVSGGSLNPAVSFGISTSHWFHYGSTNTSNFTNGLAYSIFEFAGAGLAAGIFRATRPSEYTKGIILTQ